jgi:hypothetical protein
MRIMKSDVVAMFARFLKNMNLYEVMYGYRLEYYHGYLITKVGKYGEECHPFGNVRMTGREMYLALSLANDALEFNKNKQIEV